LVLENRARKFSFPFPCKFCDLDGCNLCLCSIKTIYVETVGQSLCQSTTILIGAIEKENHLYQVKIIAVAFYFSRKFQLTEGSRVFPKAFQANAAFLLQYQLGLLNVLVFVHIYTKTS